MDKITTIAWDIDDVLNNLTACWLEKKWKTEHPDCSLNYKDIKENPPHRILGVRLDEYLQSLDEFRLSNLYLEMEPSDLAIDWFRSYGTRFRHMALTSVPILAAHQSASWVMKNFGLWIRTFHVVPSRRTGMEHIYYEQTKADYLSWLNSREEKVQIYIDDNPNNILQAEEMGVKCCLVSRPWNKGGILLEDILSDLAGRP
jgi:FMN phosphatase YigB (HAD superfamily)